MSNLHGEKISYLNLNKNKKYLIRNTFINKDINIKNKIENNENILFMPVSIYDEFNIQEYKYAKSKYTILLFGSLENGEKACIAIHGIYPYIEIEVPFNRSPEEFNKYIRDILLNLSYSEYCKQLNLNKEDSYFKIEFVKEKECEITKGKPFRYYQEDYNKYIRLYFYKTQTRRYVLNYLLSLNYKIYHDDLTCYYRVASRDLNLCFSSWNIISNYEYTNKDNNLDGHVFHINIDIDNKSIQNLSNDIIEKNNHLLKDPTLSMCWDIETYKIWNNDNSDPPDPLDPNAKLFMIGITFQWYHDQNQLLRICLVDKDTESHNDYLTIICETEENILKSFCKIIGWMKPDLILGFNDTNYDWIWLKERLELYNYNSSTLLNYMHNCISIIKEELSDKSILWKYYNKTMSKLSAEDSIDGFRFNYPGFVSIDVRTIFRQLFKNDEKSSLNWYLNRLNLPTKLDMNFKDMFDIYSEILDIENSLIENYNENSLIENNNENSLIKNNKLKYLSNQMQKVAEYCVIDAQRCHELMLKMYVIIDKRAISNMSYTSFQDAIDRADGMRVRNLIIAEGQLAPFNLKFSNLSQNINEKIKYPGAYVFPPIKGMVNAKLSIQERIIAANEGIDEYKEWLNIKEDNIKKTYNLIELHGALLTDELNKEIYNNNLPKCIQEFFSEPIKRPITGLDFNSLYPSLIMTYNLSTEYMVINKEKAKEFLNLGHNLFRIEFMYQGKKVRGWSIRHDNNIDKTKDNFKFGIFPYILKKLFDQRKIIKKEMSKWQEEMEETNLDHAEFMYNYLNAKQKALKIFMNTFYGVIGQQTSPFFMIQIAGGITLNGGRNVKLAQKYVEEHGCKVYYGDTDSIYNSIPDYHFIEIDKLYFTNKIDKITYWSELVKITLNEIPKIRDNINKYFKNDNGTNFLTMAFEEVLFPVLFASKKKYVGIAHEKQPTWSKSLDINLLRNKLEIELSNKFSEYTYNEIQNNIDDEIIKKRKKQFFIRGLDIIKRGMPNITKEIILDILESAFSVKNIYSLLYLVQNKIKEIYKLDWSDDSKLYKFIKTDVYRPKRKNIKVQTFVERMNIEHNITIKPFERFQYVIIYKYPYKYDLKGRKIPLKIGDKMELPEFVKGGQQEIDLNEYMEGGINGQLARLITYYPEFYIHCTNEELTDDDYMKTIEGKIYLNAKKYIDKYSEPFNKSYTCKGDIYKKISASSKYILDKQLSKYYSPTILKILNYKDEKEMDDLINWIKEKTYNIAKLKSKNYGNKFVNKYIKNIKKWDKLNNINIIIPQNKEYLFKSLNKYIGSSLRFLYLGKHKYSYINCCEIVYNIQKNILEHKLYTYASNLRTLYEEYSYKLEDISNIIKNNLNIDNIYLEPGIDEKNIIDKSDEVIDYLYENENELSKIIENKVNLKDKFKIINDFYNIYISMIANELFILKIKSINEYLNILLDNNDLIHLDLDESNNINLCNI
jgi:DNA polymerase elongation subunit (family B)